MAEGENWEQQISRGCEMWTTLPQIKKSKHVFKSPQEIRQRNNRICRLFLKALIDSRQRWFLYGEGVMSQPKGDLWWLPWWVRTGGWQKVPGRVWVWSLLRKEVGREERKRETGVGERQRPVCLGGREKEIRTLKDLLKGPLHLCSQGTACHAQRGDCASFPRGAWILTEMMAETSWGSR